MSFIERLCFISVIISQPVVSTYASEHTCSIEDKVCYEKDSDPALKSMTYDLDYGMKETFQAYVTPDVSTFYSRDPLYGRWEAKTPKFKGLQGKFFNMSPETMHLYWDPADGRPSSLIGITKPFEAFGTATFPGHEFYFTLPDKVGSYEVRHRFTIDSDTNLYAYDPFVDEESGRSVDDLDPREYEKYTVHKLTFKFNRYYREFTGRDWLSRFPRDPPKHFMWSADYFGQQHSVVTRETHFMNLPPESMLTKIGYEGISDEKRQMLQPHRAPEPTLNLTMTVLSCAPRAFEIKNFLSDSEVDHILELSTGLKLAESTVSGGTDRQDTKTRTSTNSWVYREHTPIVDSIYRRAADLLRIDEALLRRRHADEFPDFPHPGSHHSGTIAEALQLVHYSKGQQYTAHHDFGYPGVMNRNQPARFATLLLYLNEGMKGGETAFPRYLNAESNGSLKVVPEKGKAVLFYSFLPDGNFDDLSQHQAVPVREGDKWLVNLWVWDPINA